ncbi:hypothetical protein AYL99_11463 [Fonsecaea erecta]|uniref:Heterokaryon incompatibility domain-containing protein n=1 Tax=Fonsecaea erecta TaxID=1367422 RepID=A0A178Z3P4_9EURO|nr:hypothetical protein AYL99_11463 [Fonsecaea erecta]OAP54362.1 hypothetical protein AYL99_11463 [Fonsecaea erecta]
MALRLIHAETRHFFFSGQGTSKYAILSHTWGEGEVSLQDMVAIGLDPGHEATNRPGYAKIVQTCEQAKKDNIPYVWIDTCCIDKTSSSELSEAINTMYRWYQQAEICYAVLNDLDISGADLETALSRCRWFTRGWCLQELIAPHTVEFFDAQWNRIGSKAEFKSMLSRITHVNEDILAGEIAVGSIPVACRMSWAAGRQTTREEDTAYSLLGIFDVNMPMLYGEGGHKAFKRLQEEIIKTSNDLSIFAFPTEVQEGKLGSTQLYADLFAKHPRDFVSCGKLRHIGIDVRWNDAFALTNKGLHFHRATFRADQRLGVFIMSLNCGTSESEPVVLHFRKVGSGLYARYDSSHRSKAVSPLVADDVRFDAQVEEEAYIISTLSPLVQFRLAQADEYAIHLWSRTHHLNAAVQPLLRASSSLHWDVSRMQFLTKGSKSFQGFCKVFLGMLKPIKSTANSPQIPSGQLYVVCGVEHLTDPQTPKGWVRLLSVEKWKELETNFGLVSDHNGVAHVMDVDCTRDQITFQGSTTISAVVKLEMHDEMPRFELEINVGPPVV